MLQSGAAFLQLSTLFCHALEFAWVCLFVCFKRISSCDSRSKAGRYERNKILKINT